MLYINGKIVDLSNTKPDYQFAHVVKSYKETIALLKHKHGNAILFKSIFQPKLDPLTKMRRPHKAITIPYKANVVAPNKSIEKWVYSPEGATIKDGIAEPSTAAFILSHGAITLDIEENAELIFFMVNTSKYKRKRIFIYDENENQDKIAAQRAQDVKLSEAIYSERSPLNDTESLKRIARKWGIPGVDKMRDSTIKNALYNKVVESEDHKRRGLTDNGLDAFLYDIDDGASLVIGEDVQIAIEKGLLNFSKEASEWLLNVERNQAPWSIVRVDNADIPKSQDKLIEYLQRNPKDAQKLSNVINGNAKIERGQIVEGAPDYADERIILMTAKTVVNENDYKLLQKTYSHYELPGSPAGKSKDFLRDALKEYFEGQTAEVT